jgi:hypothetical protein
VTGEQIKTFQLIMQVSGKQLAAVLGVSEMSVNRWEWGTAPRGESRRKLDALWKGIVGMDDAALHEACLEVAELGSSAKVAWWRKFLERVDNGTEVSD